MQKARAKIKTVSDPSWLPYDSKSITNLTEGHAVMHVLVNAFP